jgi:hypothetical protein
MRSPAPRLLPATALGPKPVPVPVPVPVLARVHGID